MGAINKRHSILIKNSLPRLIFETFFSDLGLNFELTKEGLSKGYKKYVERSKKLPLMLIAIE